MKNLGASSRDWLIAIDRLRLISGEPRFQILALVSLTGWLLRLFHPGHPMIMPSICGVTGISGLWIRFGLMSALAPPSDQLSDWLTMAVAMMPLLLFEPVGNLWAANSRSRRIEAIGQFVFVYCVVWVLAGLVLIVLAYVIEAAAAGIGVAVVIPTLLIALAWQASPFKHAALFICHQRPRTPQPGLLRGRDSFFYALSITGGCLGACWALMLVPLVAAGWEFPAMLAVTFFLVLERQKPAVSTLLRRRRRQPRRTLHGTARDLHQRRKTSVRED